MAFPDGHLSFDMAPPQASALPGQVTLTVLFPVLIIVAQRYKHYQTAEPRQVNRQRRTAPVFCFTGCHDSLRKLQLALSGRNLAKLHILWPILLMRKADTLGSWKKKASENILWRNPAPRYKCMSTAFYPSGSWAHRPHHVLCHLQFLTSL